MRKLFAATLILAVAAAGAFSPQDARARTAAASEAFWKCSSGFAFEVQGNAVHCKKAAYTDKRDLAGCRLGLYALADRVGDKDMCGATNPLSGEIGIERGCLASEVIQGYTKRIVHGTDYCAKSIPAELRAPSVMVTI